MATKTTTQLIDDLDGSTAAETVTFALDGVNYEIDLSKRNASAFRKMLNQFMPQARPASAGRESPRPGSARVSAPGVNAHRVELALIRAWAADSNIVVAPRGRISATIVEQYHAAR